MACIQICIMPIHTDLGNRVQDLFLQLQTQYKITHYGGKNE